VNTTRQLASPPGIGPAFRIALIYAVVAGTYILCSDALLQALLPQATLEKHTQIQSFKGLLFILATAVLLFVLVGRALSSLATSRDELTKSQQSLTKAQSIAHLGNWEWDVQGGQVSWSGQMYDLFDIPPERGPLSYELFLERLDASDRPKVTQAIENTLHTGQPFRIEYRLPRAGLADRFILAQGEVLKDAQGRVARLFGTCLDITSRTLMENELRQLNETLERRVAERTAQLQQANEDLRTFSYTVSHDLRTPLRNMTRTAAELLQTACGRADQAAQECARRIAGSAARLDRLIADLFEYNKLARADIKPQSVNLLLLAYDVAGQLRRDPDFAEAEIVIREPMPNVLAHRPTLALVLQNLIHNAVKFGMPGVAPIVTLYAHQTDGATRLVVEDNGVGMDASRAASVFHLFEQPHESNDTGGSGIGLAIVRRGVERMGGKVGVETSPGAGSRFWIELPRDAQAS
jgi:signal transduction histidine kinase